MDAAHDLGRGPQSPRPDVSEPIAEATVHDITVPPHIRAERVDKVLAATLPHLTRSQIQRLIGRGLAWREDVALGKSDKVRAEEAITLTEPPPTPLELHPVALPLDVLFEDDDLLVVNKAAGMVVHPGAGTGEDTLVHALLHHCAGKLSGIGGVERPGIVHRLDRDTSGALVVAKSDPAFQGLARQFAERQTQKIYLALVSGHPRREHGEIDVPIGRHPVQRMKMTVRDDGRTARSAWRVQNRLEDNLALLEVQIFTGRTHQIRVHCQHLGHPLAGDPMYGFKANRHRTPFARVMLHAWRLGFAHPITGAPMELTATLPEDLAAFSSAA